MAWGSRENDDNDLIDSAKSFDDEWQKMFNEQEGNLLLLLKVFGGIFSLIFRRRR